LYCRCENRAFAIFGSDIPQKDGGSIEASEFWEIGGISFILTVLNILCVLLAAFAMFKIKEVAPIKGKTALWKNLHVARDYNKTLKGKKAQQIVSEVHKKLFTHRKQAIQKWKQYIGVSAEFSPQLTVADHMAFTGLGKEKPQYSLMDIFGPSANVSDVKNSI